jgi:ABC-type antimicrobial peptide transport system permease subunit
MMFPLWFGVGGQKTGMVWKNLLRRKARTLLTVLGISIGVAAIIGLGALADGFQRGYQSLLTGSKADLVLSQPDSFDITYSSVDAELGSELLAMPEVSEVSGMLEGFVQADDIPLFFVFGYPEDSFVLDRFQIIAGDGLASAAAHSARGTPMLLGSGAAEALDKQIGDSVRLTDTVYRVVGIYQTGDGLEDSGCVLRLADAQELLGKPRQVSLYFIRLGERASADHLIARAERLWPDLSISNATDFADRQLMVDFLQGYVWAIAGLAIIIGGVGMLNAQLMSVYERTREIGVLRAVGWNSRRVMWLILRESMLVSFAGGVLGLGLGWLAVSALGGSGMTFGGSVSNIRPAIIGQALLVVAVLGLTGGVYPAWRASRLQPAEALRYEGGGGAGSARRLPIGGMAVQGLWQRAIRSSLTLAAIGITVGSIMALEGIIRGAAKDITEIALAGGAEILIRQADIADTSLSALDARIGAKIAAFPQVKSVSGVIMSAVVLPESNGFAIVWGYAPNEQAIQRFNLVEGETIQSNHQVIMGKVLAEALNKKVGDTIELGGSRYRIKGIYESTIGWEELGGVMTLRDAQVLAGRPRKVTMYAVKVNDPSEARAVVSEINSTIPEAHAALSGEFADQMPDMQNADAFLDGISSLAIIVGGVGVLNTMLMSVFERTREIGVLRALGWRRASILGLILRESALLGLIGGTIGVVVAYLMIWALNLIPLLTGALTVVFSWDVFARAFLVALFLGVAGGLYPAFRATRLQPVEALRYE